MARLTPITYCIRPATNEDAAGIKAVVFLTLGEFGLPALPETTDADLNDLDANYSKSGGTFEVVVSPDGRIVGCVGLRLLGDGRAELRKLYLLPEVRRLGLGSLLLKRTMQRARELGCEEIHLETNRVLRDAARLYEQHGFRAVEPEHPSARCDEAYSLRLGESPVSSEPGTSALSRSQWTLYVSSPWSDHVTPLWSKGVGVPRQFGVGTALLMMTMFAILFAVLQCLQIPAIAFTFIALFFLGVGAGQALLFHGKRPRRASIVVGSVITYTLGIVTAVHDGARLYDIISFPFAGLACFLGAILGYLAGLLIAGVFLIRDGLEKFCRRLFPPKDEEP